MLFILLFFIYFLSLLLSKYYFKNWVNPISIYATIWFFMLVFFHIKLFHYHDLTWQTWVVIGFSYLSFLLGILTVYSARSLKVPIDKRTESNQEHLFHFIERNNKKIKYVAYLFGFLGLAGAIQHWMVLLSMYHSIPEVILNLARIYQLRVEGEIEGVIPYISIFTYVAIFFAGIYSAYKGRLTFVALLVLLALTLKGLANAARATILLGMVEFVITLLLTRYKLKMSKPQLPRKGLIISSIAILSIFLFALIFIKSFRGITEDVQGETIASRSLKENVLFSPTVYLYMSGHLGNLNAYLSSEGEDTGVGENSLLFVYNILSKFDITDEPRGYQKGYFVPMWINTGTFLRELHADFGLGGMYLFLYSLGLFISYLWVGFYEENRIGFLSALVYLLLIIFFSFLVMITRLSLWFFALFITLAVWNYLIKRDKRNLERNLNQNDS